jgi:hypothetical protein
MVASSADWPEGLPDASTHTTVQLYATAAAVSECCRELRQRKS